jgi:hypothetical protein
VLLQVLVSTYEFSLSRQRYRVVASPWHCRRNWPALARARYFPNRDFGGVSHHPQPDTIILREHTKNGHGTDRPRKPRNFPVFSGDLERADAHGFSGVRGEISGRLLAVLPFNTHVHSVHTFDAH